MKITMDNHWYYYEPTKIKVFINGRQTYCTEFDVEEGYVVEYVLDENNRRTLDDNGEVASQRVDGVVTVEGKRDVPLSPEEWYVLGEKND